MSTQQINIPKLGLFLGIIAAVASGLLSLVYTSTAEAISINQQKRTNEALEQVLPEFDNIPGEDVVEIAINETQSVKFYIARRSGTVVGFAGVAAHEGFSGPVEAMVGLNADGTVRKVIVTKQTETPGLGTVITDRKLQKKITDFFGEKSVATGLPENGWLDQYDGRKADGTEWLVVNDGGDVDAKTGATVTSRAVCGAVNAVSQAAVDHLEQLNK